MTTKTPKFLHTLYSILQLESPAIIAWSSCGTFFQVYDVSRLERDVLPRFFKHSKFASFQRQLNNFGFRKWTKTRASVCTFSHNTLVRCTPSELPVILAAQSMSSAATLTSTHKRPRSINVVATGVKIIHKKLKFEPMGENRERESTTDVSDLLALDWLILTEESQCGEHLEDNDDCVGLPIELFFPLEKSVGTLEPLSLGESTCVDASEWQLLVDCLA